MSHSQAGAVVTGRLRLTVFPVDCTFGHLGYVRRQLLRATTSFFIIVVLTHIGDKIAYQHGLRC
jgi:hypothetical protein